MLAKIASPPAVTAAKGALERHQTRSLSNTPTNLGSIEKSPRVEKPWGGLLTVDPTDTLIITYDGTERGLAKLLEALLVQYPNPPPPPALGREIKPGTTTQILNNSFTEVNND